MAFSLPFFRRVFSLLPWYCVEFLDILSLSLFQKQRKIITMKLNLSDVLVSHLLKTIGKLFDIFIRETVLNAFTTFRSQHAYQPKKELNNLQQMVVLPWQDASEPFLWRLLSFCLGCIFSMCIEAKTIICMRRLKRPVLKKDFTYSTLEKFLRSYGKDWSQFTL